jgi:hypothetical protein
MSQLFKSTPAWTKSADESASRTGQFCHDVLPRTFDCVDIDCVIYKRSSGLMRVIEEKLPGEQLSPAQVNILPKLATLVRLGIVNKTLHEDSGVFVVWHLSRGARVSQATDDDPVCVQKVPTNKYDMENMPTFVGKFGDIREFLSGGYQELCFTKESADGR